MQNPAMPACTPCWQYILSERFSQDPLENHFGQLRATGGCCKSPTAKSRLVSAQSLRLPRSFALEPVRGNCTMKRHLFQGQEAIDNEPLKTSTPLSSGKMLGTHRDYENRPNSSMFEEEKKPEKKSESVEALVEGVMKARSSKKHRIHAVRLIHLKRELYKRLQTFPTVLHQASVFIRQVCSSGKCVHQASVFIRQVCSPGKCVHQASVFTRQVCSSGKCVHQASVFIRQVCSSS